MDVLGGGVSHMPSCPLPVLVLYAMGLESTSRGVIAHRSIYHLEMQIQTVNPPKLGSLYIL